MSATASSSALPLALALSVLPYDDVMKAGSRLIALSKNVEDCGFNEIPFVNELERLIDACVFALNGKARMFGEDGRLDAGGVDMNEFDDDLGSFVLVDEEFGVRPSRGRVGDMSMESRASKRLVELVKEQVENGETLRGKRGMGNGRKIGRAHV